MDLLLASFQLVAQRHSILRTTFREENNQVVQHVEAQTTIPTEVVDLQHLTSEKQAKTIAEITKEKTQQTFDLAQDVLLRVTVLILSENDHLVLLSIHHIIGDRWSLQVLNKELAAAYQALVQQQHTAIAPLDIQYADYAYWQQAQDSTFSF